MKTIYLDNSATTKPSAAVIAAMTDALENGWYNPSALYRPAMDAEKAVENAREICLKAAGAANQRMAARRRTISPFWGICARSISRGGC